ncbi:MAG TPA: PIN domain-containing protein [Rhizomicrobium sp.]|jgi:predicted nucleic acid-binding protein
MLSIDTNILLYATDKDDVVRQSIAIDILTSAARVETGLTEQSIVEFANVAMRKAGTPLAEVEMIVRRWLNSFTLLVPNKDVIVDTLALLTRYQLSVWDARLLAVCGASGCNVLLSEDMQNNTVYNGVRVLNPFDNTNTVEIAQLLQPI